MKVRVVLIVDVDVDAYRAEYGDPSMTRADIRETIKSSIEVAALTDGVVVPAGIIRSVEREDRR